MGVLSVALSETAPPTAEEREIVDLLASHAAVAIGNARLFAESETRRRTAEALAEVWRFLSETFDVVALGQRIADVVLRALRVRAAVLYRLQPGPGDLEVIGRAGEAERFYGPGVVIPAGHGVVGLAVNRRQPVITPDVRVDTRFVVTASMLPGPTLCPSVLSLPLLVKGQVVGGFTVGDVLGRVYTDEDLRLAQTFADQAAVALENARLFAETERRRRESVALGNVSQTLAQSLHPGAVAQRPPSFTSIRCRARWKRPRAQGGRPSATGRSGTRAAPGRSGSRSSSGGRSSPTTSSPTRACDSPPTSARSSRTRRSGPSWRCRSP
jgi:GAF domain-containing protein